MTQRPLYERDPEAWRAHLAEGNARQPRKRTGADALIRDERGRVLIVDPTYKPDWDLPGGMAEANEAPADALARELKEELGLDLSPGRLLYVDWVPPHGPWDDSLMFVFDTGTLPDGRADHLHPTDDELATIKFAAPATSTTAPHTLRSNTKKPVLYLRELASYLRKPGGPGRFLTCENAPYLRPGTPKADALCHRRITSLGRWSQW